MRTEFCVCVRENECVCVCDLWESVSGGNPGVECVFACVWTNESLCAPMQKQCYD